ncbi:MAG TPA: RHS repeat-associated core domain-containing protein, partial [Phycisphaerales bacterium]|nr:RHS repeat-associated core domain-containing protein [Phycisphaerales bacterium]
MTLPASSSTGLFLRLIIVLGALFIGAPPASARVFDPETGRFLQRDPLGYPDGPNPYRYGHSNPVRGSDPSGTLWLLCPSGECEFGFQP